MFRDAVLRAAADAIEHLGEPVTLPGGAVTRGVFRYPTESTEIGGTPQPARDPVLVLNEMDATSVVRGSTVTVRGRQFDATDRFPTGNGLVRIPLVETTAATGPAWK